MGQYEVSGGVSVLCSLAAPVAMFSGNLRNLVNKLPEGRLKRSMAYSCPMSLDESRAALRIKHS